MDRILVDLAMLTGTMSAKLTYPMAIPALALLLVAGLFGLRWWWMALAAVVVIAANGGRIGPAATMLGGLAWLCWVLIAWGVGRVLRWLFRRRTAPNVRP